MAKTKNPLRRRYLREVRQEAGKYIVIFLLLFCSIALISGFLVAAGSTLAAYNEGFARYNAENGNFTTKDRMNKAQLKDADALGITVYEQFFAETPLENGSTMRFYKNRSQINLACLMQGELPSQPGETALDRMYAENNGLSVGDTFQAADGRSWQVTGLIALPDYSCLFQNNNDTMFDSVKFGVGVLCAKEFSALPQDSLTWRYAWQYEDPPADEAAEKEMAEDLLDSLGEIVHLSDYIPRYQNQAITFTGEDMGGDRATMAVLLYIITAIIAFVFTITTSSTIEREAGVIGTLRAMGYTRGELVRHYMAMPVIITLISALLGNIFGYTLLKIYCASMYYGSYSLPTYQTVWSADAFVQTTVVPVCIMLVVNFTVLRRKLKLSPLRFLRHELARRRKAHAFPLPGFLPFFARFRLRVLMQNLGSYIMIFFGVCFADLLLLFGLGLPDLLDNYAELVTQSMPCPYQYMLTMPAELQSGGRKLEKMMAMLQFASGVETENPDAEKFSAYSLKTTYPDYKTEDITLYGIQPGSCYISAEVGGGKVAVTSALADKYALGPGDTITLKEPYESTQYTLTITSVFSYDASVAVYLSQADLNQLFDFDKDYFCGYFSATPITDIEQSSIGTVIDYDAMTKLSRQLKRSMGSMMGIVDAFAVLIFIVVIYIMSKIIIERNAQAISMAKILGYNDLEIARLYIIPTSLVVIVCLAASLPMLNTVLRVIVRYMCLIQMSGWIPYLLSDVVLYKTFAIGIVTYLAVAVLELRRIRRVPMGTALKNTE